MIVEKGDSTQITKLFDYYGYILQGTTDGYKVMKHPSGNEISYLVTLVFQRFTNIKSK